MGDRISIQFQNGKDKSVVLFSHWGGQQFLKDTEQYVKNLKEWIKTQSKNVGTPLMRLEVETVMVDFIRHITKDEEKIDSDLYVMATEHEGDNSDNGHYVIDLNDGVKK